MMPSWVSKVSSFFRRVFHRERKIILNIDSIEIEILPDKDNTKALDRIIAGVGLYTGMIEAFYIDELLFAPCPIINCIHYENCKKNLFKCDWIKEEMLMKINE